MFTATYHLVASVGLQSFLFYLFKFIYFFLKNYFHIFFSPEISVMVKNIPESVRRKQEGHL